MKLLFVVVSLAFLTSASAEPVRILPIGDSITQGGKRGVEEFTYRWPLFGSLKEAGVEFDFIGTRTAGLDPEAKWPDYKGTAFDLDHEGYYGGKTAKVVAEVTSHLGQLAPPDIALIHLGTNDQNAADLAAAVIQPLETLIAQLRARNPKVAVLVGHLNFNGGAALKIRTLVEEMAQRLHTPASPVVTVHHYRGWKENPQAGGTDTFDWAHPNPQGQRKMADAWFAAMKPFLKTGNSASNDPAPQRAETWDFSAKPDPFTADALLDLRSLNEKQSGESGFVKLSADGNSFVTGNGQPIRFWAVGADGYTLQPDEMDRQCRWLAKMGVNLVRLHFNVPAEAPQKPEDPVLPITALNEKLVEGLYRYLKAAKDNGIYVCISPYWAHHEMPASWAIDGFASKQQLWGALFLSEKLQEAYRGWTRELYTRVNPHTGLAIKDDPTVAFLQVQNEDSLFFWTQQKFPAPLKHKLGELFHQWCMKKYGSAEAALTAWEGAKHQADDPAGGVIGVHDVYDLTRPVEGGKARRLRDQTQFMAEHQRAFYAGMGEHFRGLGCKQLLNASNWRTASDGTLKDIERWTYGALQWDAENRYTLDRHTGENAAWRVQGGHKFVSASAIREPLSLPAVMRQQEGHPFMVTENTWPSPNAYQAEMAMLGAAYQSLTGGDGICWFAVGNEGWASDPTFPYWDLEGGKALRKFVVNQPHIAGMWPANALLFRRGDVREAAPVVRETRPLQDLWERKPPIVADHEYPGAADELRRARMDDGAMSRAAFFIGPVRWSADAERSATERRELPIAAKMPTADLSAQIADGTITSATGELSLNPARGLFRVAAPRSQGVAGFLREAGGRFELPDTTIETKNKYAVVQLVSLDDAPLASSEKVLVQIGTTARPTGWQTRPAEFDAKGGDKRIGEEVITTGAAPWQIEKADAVITLKNPHLTKATRLDPQGYPAGDVAVVRNGAALTFNFPPSALWLVLE